MVTKNPTPGDGSDLLAGDVTEAGLSGTADDASAAAKPKTTGKKCRSVSNPCGTGNPGPVDASMNGPKCQLQD